MRREWGFWRIDRKGGDDGKKNKDEGNQIRGYPYLKELGIKCYFAVLFKIVNLQIEFPLKLDNLINR